MPTFRQRAQAMDRVLLRCARDVCWWLSTLPYGAVVSLRNAGFESGAIRVRHTPLPVISIGNVTTGGTGKTPVVAWMVRQLQSQGLSPAIVSRGYGAVDAGGNDEKKMLDRMCPGVPHRQNRSRYEGVMSLLQPNLVDSIVLDDGMQHRQLHRDLEITLLDATNPWGRGQLLPWGRLREPLRSLRRADVILLTRCELCTDESVQKIRNEAARWSSAPILRTRFIPSGFSNLAGERTSEDELQRAPLAVFCGIGNPQGFFASLASLGIEIPPEQRITFPDHHHYTAADLDRITRAARSAQAHAVVATHKDLVKIAGTEIHGLPLWGLDQQLDFIDDPAPLLNQLRTLWANSKSAASSH